MFLDGYIHLCPPVLHIQEGSDCDFCLRMSASACSALSRLQLSQETFFHEVDSLPGCRDTLVPPLCQGMRKMWEQPL